MALFNKSTILVIGMLFILTACGGNSSSDSNDEVNCVIGSSKIGECKV